jgi:hypothetical protein
VVVSEFSVGKREQSPITYKSWSALAGYFDGDGTVEFSVRIFTLEIRLAFDENWKLHLDGIRNFLETRAIICGGVRKKESYNTWHLVISRISSVRILARKLAKYCVKKRGELALVVKYMDNRMTAEGFVKAMNEFVIAGERTGKIKAPGAPYTRSDGKELSHRR